MDKELKEFIDYRNNYKFKQLDIVEDGDNLYCDGELLKDINGYITEVIILLNYYLIYFIMILIFMIVILEVLKDFFKE